MRIKGAPLLLLLGGVLFFFSCRPEDRLLEKEDLFVIPMGIMADELDYFYRANTLLPGSSDLFVQNGRIYLTSSHAGKIMEMNSYGDLLSLIYNPQTNPEPAQYLKQDNREESLIRIRKWNFRQIDHIAADEERLLVVDRVEDGLASNNEGILYNRVILRFDQEGEYLDSLGQEGVNGTPFSYIQDLRITRNGEIVVITQSSSDKVIFWFSSEGQLLYKVVLDNAHLPQVEDPGWSPGQIEKIAPDLAGYKLYLKIDYFPLEDSPEGEAMSRLYTLDLQDEAYGSFFDIPRFEVVLGDQTIEGVNEYLGAVAGGLHFFIGSDFNGKYHLTVMDAEGAVKTSRILRIQDQDTIFRNLYLAPNGLLAGIFYEEKGARVSWWRADRIAERYAED